MIKKRKDVYWGLHFDFHAVASTRGIGTRTKAEEIGRYLDMTRPDFVQIDTKGHPGYTSFFSEYEGVAPGLEVDHLKIIREETKRRGILLFAHHSSIYDVQACTAHPEWAAILQDGTRSTKMTSILSPYVDKKLIPQLKELALRYGFDGAWIDGDCAMMCEEYHPAILEEFYQKSGFHTVDSSMDSPSRKAFRIFCREKFIEYIRYYMTEVKKSCPDFEFTSNYAFSPMLPQKPIDEIDYLSLDACSVLDIRATARCFSGAGKPWDIMSWGTSNCFIDSEGGFFPRIAKHVSRLCREAAMVISMGGAYQISNVMTSQGEIRMSDAESMKQVSEFVYQRKPFCYGSRPLKNAAILLSDMGRDKFLPDTLLNGTVDLDLNLCDIFIDGGRPIDILHRFEIEDGSFADRSAIILPETADMTEEDTHKLREYIKAGGNLIVCGPALCRRFVDLTSAQILPQKERIIYVDNGEFLFGMRGNFAIFQKNSAQDIWPCYDGIMDRSAPLISAAIHEKYGKGSVALIGWNILEHYTKTKNFAERDCMRLLMDAADPKPAACLKSGLRRVEIIPAEKDGKLLINLINTTELYLERFFVDHGRCDEHMTPDWFPPLPDLEIAVRCPAEPTSIYLEPEHTVPAYTREDEYLIIHIKQLSIHTIIVIETQTPAENN